MTNSHQQHGAKVNIDNKDAEIPAEMEKRSVNGEIITQLANAPDINLSDLVCFVQCNL